MFFTHLRLKEPCSLFYHSELKVDKDPGSTLIFISVITVNFSCSSTRAIGKIDDKANTITIKVPPFFKHTPETWFVYLEAQFHIKRITAGSAKFYWCISALPSNVSAQLTHMIRDPGEDQKFETLINLPFTSDITFSVLMSFMLKLYIKKFKPD